MALQSSGPISLANLATEFGGSAPHSLSEYYRGGGLVPNASQNNSIPTSGVIGLGSFYGGVNRIPVTITISSNQTNYVLNTAKVAGYVAGVMDVTLVINSGVYLSANSTGSLGLQIDNSWAAGDTISVINNGFIVGMGGAGGAGSSYPQSGAVAGAAGAGGGAALHAMRPVSVTNNGTIAGGGGGGGGGRSRGAGGVKGDSAAAGGGGGGGGRSSVAANSAAGAGGTSHNTSGTLTNGAAGGVGTSSSAGGGGSGGNSGGVVAGSGGAGGGWGAAGSSGASGTGGNGTGLGPYAGGAGGSAVVGNGNITWVATGTRLGAIT